MYNPNAHMKELVNHLDRIVSRGYNAQTVFSDWLDLMLFALMRDDPRYLEVVGRYRNEGEHGKREIDHFCGAFAQLQLATAAGQSDVLGLVYMDWCGSNKYAGQFFTPEHVAAMMAKMSGVPTAGQTVLDPACGSGIMLVETCKLVDARTLYDVTFYGQDLSATCAKMCALNLLFFNLNSFVIQGNSLGTADHIVRVFQTKRTVAGGVIRELTADQLEDFKHQYDTMMRNTEEARKAPDAQEAQLPVCLEEGADVAALLDLFGM